MMLVAKPCSQSSTSVTLLIYLLLPLACVGAVPGLGKNTGLPARLVVGVVLYEIVLLASGLLVGFLGLLNTPAYLLLSGAALSLLAAITVARRRNWTGILAGTIGLWRTEAGPLITIAGLMACWIIGVQVTLDAVAGTYHTDGLTYHIPRALFWLWHGDFSTWPAPEWQQVGLPIAADVISGSKIFLRDGWHGLAYVTTWLTVGALASVYVGGRALGLTRRWAIVATLMFFAFPSVGQRLVAGNSDMAASFPVLASAIFLLVAANLGFGGACAVVCGAVAVACKPTVLIPLLMVDGAALAWRIRRRRIQGRPELESSTTAVQLLLGACLAVVILVASYLPVYEAFGNFLGGEVGRAHSTLSGGALAAPRAAAESFLHWVLEPLGYVPRVFRDSLFRGLHLSAAYAALGAEDGESMLPNASPENTGTGVLSLALLAIAMLRAPMRLRKLSAAAIIAFLLSASIIAMQAWSSRFFVVIYALFALLGVASVYDESSISRRWCLALLTAAMAVAAVGTTRWSLRQFGDYRATRNLYAVLPGTVRAQIVSTIGTRPLLVLADVEFPPIPAWSSIALLSGPDAALRIEYLTCKNPQDWGACLRTAAARSPWLAVVYGENEQLRFGPYWPDPTRWSSGNIDRGSLSGQLAAAGWKRTPMTAGIELWSTRP